MLLRRSRFPSRSSNAGGRGSSFLATKGVSLGTSVLSGPATVTAPQGQGFCCFGANRDGGATVTPPYDLGFLATQVNRGAVDSAAPRHLGKASS